MTSADELLYALPHLGDTFTLDVAATTLRTLDHCGWPVPTQPEELGGQLESLVRGGALEKERHHYRIPPETLVKVADEGIPELPVADVNDRTVGIPEALTRTTAALLLVAHRLRRSLPQ